MDVKQIARQVINESLAEAKPYWYQTPGRAKDSVQGRYLRYSPEDSSFDSASINPNFERDEAYNSSINNEVNNALSALSKARETAFKKDDMDWYLLLNAIMGELYDKVNGVTERRGPYHNR